MSVVKDAVHQILEATIVRDRSGRTIRYTGCPDAPVAIEVTAQEVRTAARWRAFGWYCKDCFNSWPEDPPPTGLHGIPESQKRYLAEMAAEYASLTADVAIPVNMTSPRWRIIGSVPTAARFFWFTSRGAACA
jgi:hypothetical protein